MAKITTLKDALLRIDELEKQVNNNLIQTVNKFNRGMQRQFEFLADEMLSSDMKLSLTDDKEVDRWLKIVKEYKPIMDAMNAFEQKANGTQKDESKKVVKEDGVEQFIKTTTVTTTT